MASPLTKMWIDAIRQDVTHGVRVLRRRPAIFSSAVLVLGLTLGSTMALVLLMDRLLLRPISIQHPDRLVQIIRRAGPGGVPQESFPAPVIDRLREATAQFGVLLTVGYPSNEFVSYSRDGFRPEAVRTQAVDVAAFATFGVLPSIGQAFMAGDESVAVLSHDYWQKRFLSAPDVIVRSIGRRGKSFRIMGVLARGFSELDTGSSPDIWFPVNRGQGGRVLVALRANASPIQLESALIPVFKQYLDEQPPNQARQGNARYLSKNLSVVDASTGMSGAGLRKRFTGPLTTVTLGAVVLLVIGCVNVSLLLLTLQLSRHREMAVRVALGASRGRMTGQLVLETAILAVMGCVLGMALAPVITSTLVGLASDPDNPIRLTWQWDSRLAVVSALCCVLATSLCAASPVLRLSWRTPAAVAKRKWMRPEDLLLAGQAALALVLLVGAGLLQSTWRNLDGLDPGFDKQRLVIAELQWEREGSRAHTNLVYRTLIERVDRLPGVAAASISGWSYFGDNSRRAAIVTEHPTGNAPCEFLSVGPRFFETTGVKLLRGRDFTSRDFEGSPLVAVLNQAAVREYFGTDEALGQRFSIFDPKQKIEIIGVVADTRLNSLREQGPPMVYLPFLQSEFRGTSDMPASITVRLAPGSSLAAVELQRIIRTTAAGLASRRVRTQSSLVERSLLSERLLSVISTGLGMIALLLTALGLAAAVAQSVASRLKEFAVRLALGARNNDLIAGGLARALTPVAVGIAVGAPLSVAAAQLLGSMLFGVDPFDPLIISGAALLFLAATTGAASLPLFQATRIDPAAALHRE